MLCSKHNSQDAKGNYAQRPSSTSGEMRFNTSTNTMEYYNGTRWVPTYEDPDTTNIPTNGLVANWDATLGSGTGYSEILGSISKTQLET